MISVVVVSCTFMCYWSARLRFSRRLLVAAQSRLHPWLNLLVEFRSDRATYLLGSRGRHNVLQKRDLHLFLSSSAKTGKDSAIRVICLLLLMLSRTIVTFHAWCMTFVTCAARVTFRWHRVDHMLLLLWAHLEIVGVYWGLSGRWVCLDPLPSLIHHDASPKWALRFDCNRDSEALAPFCCVYIGSLVHLVLFFSIVSLGHLLKLQGWLWNHVDVLCGTSMLSEEFERLDALLLRTLGIRLVLQYYHHLLLSKVSWRGWNPWFINLIDAFSCRHQVVCAL